MDSQERIAIIGAGVAGLAAAHALVEGGRKVTVLDKGRGPGGRISSRLRDTHAFDHGAPFFTAHDERFRARVERWIAAGVVAPWNPRVASLAAGQLITDLQPEDFFVGVPRMSSLAESMAAELDVRQSVEVAALRGAVGRWELLDAEGHPVWSGDRVVCTAPAPQTAVLLDGHTALAAEARNAVMESCWVVMVAPYRPVELEFDAAFVRDGALSWVARDSSKPGRSGVERWVLQASPEWSRQHLEDEPEQVISALVSSFTEAAGGSLPATLHLEAHRWRHARPLTGLEAPFLCHDSAGIAVAGDWCAGPRVENAWLSGRLLAERLLNGN